MGAEAAEDGANADSWQTWPLIIHLAQVLVEQAGRNDDVRRLDQAIQLVQQVSITTLARHEHGEYRGHEKGDLYVESLFFTALLLKQRYYQAGDYLSLCAAARYASAAADSGAQSGRQWQRYGQSAAGNPLRQVPGR